jgi:lysosomal acid lipase/cholesteryl ester hydrolase
VGEKDLPAFVDYVLDNTGFSSLGYVGHSEVRLSLRQFTFLRGILQGTIQCFAALSEFPELKEKINVFIALAPVAFVSHQQSKIFSALEVLHIDEIAQLLGQKEFLPSTKLIETLGEVILLKAYLSHAHLFIVWMQRCFDWNLQEHLVCILWKEQ